MINDVTVSICDDFENMYFFHYFSSVFKGLEILFTYITKMFLSFYTDIFLLARISGTRNQIQWGNESIPLLQKLLKKVWLKMVFALFVSCNLWQSKIGEIAVCDLFYAVYSFITMKLFYVDYGTIMSGLFSWAPFEYLCVPFGTYFILK